MNRRPRESVNIDTAFIDANVDGGDTEEEANVDIVDINNLLPPDGLILPAQAPDPESPGWKRDEPYTPQTSMSEPPPRESVNINTAFIDASYANVDGGGTEPSAQNLPHGLRIKRSKETLFSGKRLTSKRESG